MNKKDLVLKHFENSNKLVSIQFIQDEYKLSKSYTYRILAELRKQDKISKVKGKINYYICVSQEKTIQKQLIKNE